MTWHTHSQPSTCSQGPEEAFSLTSYLDTLRSERARLNPTLEACSSNASVTECSQDSRFGTTSTPLTERRGEAQLTFLQEDSLAKTSVRRVKEQELAESVRDYGRNMRDSLERCGLDLSLPKTHLCFALGDLELSSKTWPRWGIMLDGELSELGMSVRHINETECGSWRTPMASEWKDMSCANQIYLQDQVLGRKGQTWPTPNASDNRDRGNLSDPVVQRRIRIGKQIGLSTAVKPTQTGGSLNPTWVEWLMGWPLGWTDLKPLAMDKFQQWQHSHGKFSPKTF